MGMDVRAFVGRVMTASDTIRARSRESEIVSQAGPGIIVPKVRLIFFFFLSLFVFYIILCIFFLDEKVQMQ